MSIANPLPNCLKFIKLEDLCTLTSDTPIKNYEDKGPLFSSESLTRITDLAKKASQQTENRQTPAEKLEKTLAHQSSALLAGATALVLTANAAASQLKMESQKLSIKLRKQKIALAEMNDNLSTLRQYHMVKKLKGSINWSQKPPPTGMYS